MTDRRVVALADARDAAFDLLRGLAPGAKMSAEGTTGVVALQGDRAVGVPGWGAFPGFDGVAEVYLELMVRAGVDRGEVGGALLEAALRRIEARPSRAWVHVEDEQSYLQDVLAEHGFTHHFTACIYESPLPLPQLTPRAAWPSASACGSPVRCAPSGEISRRSAPGKRALPGAGPAAWATAPAVSGSTPSGGVGECRPAARAISSGTGPSHPF